MLKRGQVSAFLIIGILILIIVILLFSFKDSILEKISSQGKQPLNVEKQLESKMSSISDKITKCTNEEVTNVIKLISDQGGYLEMNNYKTYHGRKVTVLCSKYDKNQNCFNQVPVISLVEENLNNYLQQKIVDCVKILDFETSDINLKYEKPEVEVKINKMNIVINLYYPITVIKDKQQFGEDKFVINVDSSFGKFLEIANIIVGDISTGGYFNVAEFSNTDPGWIVDPRVMSDYTVYRITDYYEKNEFWLSVEK